MLIGQKCLCDLCLNSPRSVLLVQLDSTSLCSSRSLCNLWAADIFIMCINWHINAVTFIWIIESCPELMCFFSVCGIKGSSVVGGRLWPIPHCCTDLQGITQNWQFVWLCVCRSFQKEQCFNAQPQALLHISAQQLPIFTAVCFCSAFTLPLMTGCGWVHASHSK